MKYYFCVGDSGYTPSATLLTPVLNTVQGSPASQYTFEFLTSRCKVEQTIGMLTNVWRVLSRTRTLSYSPDKVAQFINSAIILHNFRRKYG